MEGGDTALRGVILLVAAQLHSRKALLQVDSSAVQLIHLNQRDTISNKSGYGLSATNLPERTKLY
jgi:hypothetical protein